MAITWADLDENLQKLIDKKLDKLTIDKDDPNKKNIDWTIYYHQEGEDKTFINKLNSFKICDEQINAPIRW